MNTYKLNTVLYPQSTLPVHKAGYEGLDIRAIFPQSEASCTSKAEFVGIRWIHSRGRAGLGDTSPQLSWAWLCEQVFGTDVISKCHRPVAIKRLWLKQINSPKHTRSEVSTYSITAPGGEGCQDNYVCSSQATHAGKKPSLKILPLPKHVHCIYFCFVIQRLTAALLAHIYCVHTHTNLTCHTKIQRFALTSH